MSNFVVVSHGGSTVQHRAVFRDISEGRVPNARHMSVGELHRPRSPLRRVLTSRRFKRLLARCAPLRALFGRASQRPNPPQVRRLRKLLRAGDENYVILCPGTSSNWVNDALLDELRAEPLCRHLIYYFIDSLASTARASKRSEEEMLRLLRRFDAVFTYDRTDAARYAELMRFVDIPIWRAETGRLNLPPDCDLYYCGTDKHRLEALREVHARLTEAGAKLRYRLVSFSEHRVSGQGIEYVEWTPYEQTVAELLRANCILEFIASNNNEATLRYKEAVIYNKKLLTNNPAIAGLPYYDPRWMRVFRSARDIDVEWLRAVEPIDYGYRGDFSAETFIQNIERLASE